MSPRPYRLGRRREVIDEGRARILEAARSLLSEATSYAAFTVDAVARRADVARATVYYQFESKTGLLEALCDALAETGQLERLAEAFTAPDAEEALRRFVVCFGRFWAVDRLAMRRLRALAALDPDVASVIADRDGRRRMALRVLAGRFRLDGDEPGPADSERLLRILYTLTSFETFDSLAAPEERLTEVAEEVIRLAAAARRH